MAAALLGLLVILVVLGLVAWGGRAVLAGIGAPSWLLTVGTVIVLIVAVLLIANTLGIATPALR